MRWFALLFFVHFLHLTISSSRPWPWANDAAPEAVSAEAARRVTRKPWIISVGDRLPTIRGTRTTSPARAETAIPTIRRRSRPRYGTRPTRPMSTRRFRTTERPRSSTSVWTTRVATPAQPSTASPVSITTAYYAPTSALPRTRATTTTTKRPTTTTTQPPTTTTTTTAPAVTSRADYAPRIAPTVSPISTTTRNPRTKPTFNPTRTPKLSTSAAPPTDWTFGSETDPTTPRKPATPSRAPNDTREIVPLKESCVECICMGSSGCNYQTKCGKDEECGPYKIDYAYWYEAGYPGYEGDENDFKKCVQSKECAETTVKQYIARYAKDCNDDGIIDCIDYAAIHKSGPGECSKQWVYESKFWTSFSDCHGFDFKRRR